MCEEWGSVTSVECLSAHRFTAERFEPEMVRGDPPWSGLDPWTDGLWAKKRDLTPPLRL